MVPPAGDILLKETVGAGHAILGTAWQVEEQAPITGFGTTPLEHEKVELKETAPVKGFVSHCSEGKFGMPSPHFGPVVSTQEPKSILQAEVQETTLVSSYLLLFQSLQNALSEDRVVPRLGFFAT